MISKIINSYNGVFVFPGPPSRPQSVCTGIGFQFVFTGPGLMCFPSFNSILRSHYTQKTLAIINYNSNYSDIIAKQ